MTACPSSDTLYAEDFSLWTQQQAALWRTGQWQELDYENLTEEIESMGHSEKRDLGHRLEVLLTHLLKMKSFGLRGDDGESLRLQHAWRAGA